MGPKTCCATTRPRSSPAADPPGSRQSHRPKAARIDADIVLARKRLQLAVAVPMKVDRAAMLAVPAPERVMAEDEPAPLRLHLVIIAHARPARQIAYALGIVVAADEVNASVQPLQQPRHIAKLPSEVAEMPDLVLLAHRRVPRRDQRGIHLGHRRERTLVDVERSMISKMRVAGEEKGHPLPTLLEGCRCRSGSGGLNRRRSGSKLQR